MRATVVDASAIAAILFDEPQAAPIIASAPGALIAPTLIRYEIASVCATKMIRHPGRAQELQARYRLLDALALEVLEPAWHALPALACRYHISAYDAAYLQLALAHGAVLVTLDARLAAAWDDATRQ
jgi:predicted nucleic acid-binding protein